MRWKCLHHVGLSVVDYDASIDFYDRMLGWLGYKSFWTLDIGYKSTYYVPNMLSPHSYIGIQPARTGTKVDSEARTTGIHHIDTFYKDFLLKNDITVTELPAEYPIYAPGYYAVFFNDPVSGIHLELAHTPFIPSPRSFLRWKRAINEASAERHPDWSKDALKHALRTLPRK